MDIEEETTMFTAFIPLVFSENRENNTELHGWLKELKRDAIHIKELHWRWEKRGPNETNFRELAQNIISITTKLQNTLRIESVTTLPTQNTKVKRPSLKRRLSGRKKEHKSEKEDTARDYQQLTGDEFHDVLKSLKADSISLKKLYKEAISKGKSPADDQDFRTCAGKITYYCLQLENRLGFVDLSQSYRNDVSNSSHTQYLDMERGQKRKRDSYSPEKPDIPYDNRAPSSRACQRCEDLKQEVDCYYQNNEKLHINNKDLAERNKKLEADISKLKQQLENQNEEARRHPQKLNQGLENQKEEGRRYPQNVRSRESEAELRRSVELLQNQLTSERKAKDNALTRLAAEAGRKMFDNNPGITDLSDPNRPMKLAEQMSELYDNEWTTALENLISNRLTEEQAVKYLLKTLTDIYLFCEDAANMQFREVLAQIVVPDRALKYSSSAKPKLSDPPADLNKSMKDYRKRNWQCAVPLLQKAFMEQKISDGRTHLCKEYVDKSMKLCWLMKVQDPPVHMEWNYSNGNFFDTSIFRTFTKKGNAVDFVVWPILYLHKNGPILNKGIAQGKKTQQMQNTVRSTVI